MTAVFVRLEGLKGVIDTLKQLPPELVSKRGGVVKAALRKGAVIVQKEMQRNVDRIIAEPNVDDRPTKSTGALLAAVKIRRRRSVDGGGNGEALSVGPGKKLGKFYAWFLEYGTERMRPHPFVRPAYEATKDAALSAIVQGLISGVDKALRKLQGQNGVKR